MRVEQWEAEENQYNDRTRNKIPDDRRLEILVAMLPTALEQEFRMRIVTPESTYSGIRQKSKDHVQRLTSISGRRQATPMDCSPLDLKAETLGKGTVAATGAAGVPNNDSEGEPLWTFEYDPEMLLDFDIDLNFVRKGGGKVGGRWTMKGKGKGTGGSGRWQRNAKGKAKGDEKFTGECGTCGKVGHKAQGCRSGLPAYQRWNKQNGNGANNLDSEIGAQQDASREVGA